MLLLLTLKVVKAPVFGVVAPTVPLMLMEAVPVRLVTTPDAGVPRAGVTSVGLLANTKAPVPVSSVTAAARLADDGVAKKVATPDPKPEMPVETGKPVAFVKVPEEGVPSAPPFTTTEPEVPTFTPKAVATFVPKPEIPVATGRPVAFVNVADEGVPRAGVTSVGDVANTKAPDPVSSDTAAARLADEGVARNVATPAPRPEMPVATGNPVAFVKVAEDGVPRSGVVSVGLVARTLLPVPVLVTLTTFLLASSAKAVEAVRPDRVVVPLTDRLVKAPEPELLLTLIKSVPLHATTADSPLTIVTPVVGPTPRNTIDCVPPDSLMTM
jgi:hypothetical protein